MSVKPIILWPDIAVDMKIESVGSQAGGSHCHKGDVELFIIDIEYFSSIATQAGFGFKKLWEVQYDGEHTVKSCIIMNLLKFDWHHAMACHNTWPGKFWFDLILFHHFTHTTVLTNTK